jgi:hypothetical protein
MKTELLLEPAHAEARRVRGDDECTDLGGTLVGRASPGRDDVGSGLAGIRDEPFATVQDPAASIRPVLEACGRPRAACVRSGARLGQPIAAQHPARGHRHQIGLLLLLRAGKVERTAAKTRVRGDDEPERTPHPSDLLDGDRVGERVEAGAALVLGDRDTEPAHLAEPCHDVARKSPLAFVLVDLRRDFVQHEVADRLAQEAVFGRQVEIHRAERSTGCVADDSTHFGR